jgi:DNA-directed RNA polymerase specialized sigma24 family protein
MEEQRIEQLIAKLDTITRLLAHQVSQAHETLETKAAVLSSLGLKPKEIAAICGTTAGTISVRLAEAKKKNRKNKKAKRR